MASASSMDHPAAALYVERLAEETRTIRQHPLVNDVKLFPDDPDTVSKFNDIGAYLTLKAEFVPLKHRRRPKVHCSKDKPTQLDALNTLKLALARDYEAELAAAAAAAEAVSAAAAAETSSAFNRLVLAAGMAHRALLMKAKDAEMAVAQAIAAEQAAAAARQDAEVKHREAKLALRVGQIIIFRH